MKKYTKHYMEIALIKLKMDEFFFEQMEVDAREDEFFYKYSFDENLIKKLIESEYVSNRYVVRYPEIITDGRPVAKVRFYDINYIDDDGLIYESTAHNYSNWVCFGERNYIANDECWCFNENGSFSMKTGDLTFEEVRDNYFGNEEKSNKVKKIK